MRKQYHLRRSDRGLLAWDVDTLVALSAKVPVEELPLSAIGEIDEDWWFAHGQVPTVRAVVEHVQLMRDCDLTYPILVDADGRVMDGMHRIARALSEGRTSVLARRLPELPEPDFVGVAPEDLPYD